MGIKIQLLENSSDNEKGNSIEIDVICLNDTL
jgi:hypothetical protein